MKFADLPPDLQEKARSDVYCIHCQQSFRVDDFAEREFRGRLFIEAPCPRCGKAMTKPVGPEQ
ncbi:MAG TPA: hypothetical protein VHL58_19615 [Thermoanaerobaculia bacterium]|nr:hypothetical protein [Thermoanaerobaculia bacterium]